MGKPASTLGCYHTCPDKTGKKDHIGGNMVTASSNVFIGGMPAAREGDKLVCRGPADTMVQSSSSVFFNGKGAVRVGDGTAHGGTVVVGNPTVDIGDAGVSVSAAASGAGVARLDFGKGSGAASSGRSSAVHGGSPKPYAPLVDLSAQRAAILKGNATCPVCEASDA